MNELLSEIVKKINRASTIALYCHTSPDGDTLASALAIYIALTKKGKSVDIYCDSEVPKKFFMLKNIEKVTLPDKGVHDLAIAIDCSDLDRLSGTIKSYLSARSQIAIDHHKTHERFAELTLLDPNASACAEIVFKLLKYMKSLDNDIAKLLFTAIVADSGCFSYSSTTPETHKIACELLEFDFDSSAAIYDIHKRSTKNIFDLRNRVLSKCKFFEENQIAIIIFLKDDFAATATTSSDTEGIIVGAIDIETVKIAYALSEANDKSFKVSIRTKEDIDASDCAKHFGGGGHKNAAGCRINGYLEDIIEKLVKIAKDRL